MTSHQPDAITWFNEDDKDCHLHAFSYIDLCDLDTSGVPVGRQIMEDLLKNNSTDKTITPSSLIDKKLFQLQLDFKNTNAYSAYHPMGLGFPIIKLKDNKTGSYKLAPLFIWKIRLAQQNNSSWDISHKQEDTIRLNFPLYRYLKKQYKLDLFKLSHTLLVDKKLNAISLSRICYELSSTLGKKEDLFVENIQNISQKTDGSILCAGVLSNFFDPLTFSKTKIKSNNKPALSVQHSFGFSTLDPWQAKAFQNLLRFPQSIVSADPGTGKSHLLHFSIINGLSNGLSSIVVADSVHRIKKIRNELSANGLDHLLLDITNPEKDLPRIIQALSYKSSLPKEDFDEANFKYLINRCKRHKDRLDTSFQVLNQVIFDKDNWFEIVGNYLSNNRIERHELLDNLVDSKAFTFHPTEYLSLKEAVNNSEPIYLKINNLKHPLHVLHPDIFLEKSKEEAAIFIKEQLELFFKKFDLLHRRYILKQQDYAKDLRNNQETFFQETLVKIESLKDLIEDNRLLYGNTFEESGLISTGKLKVYGVFSGKHKNILQARNLVNENYKTLGLFVNQQADVEANLFENVDAKSISKIISNLNSLEDQLYDWHEKVPEQLQEELQRLNTKSVHSSLDYEEQINELEYTLDMNIEELNTSGLYLNAFQNKMLTIPMRQLFIQDIIDQLKNTKNHLKDFDAFYEWQRHWLLLPEIHRKLLTAIIKVNPKSWITAFKSWYFFQRLKTDFHFKMPRNEQALLAFKADVDQLKEQIPVQIRHRWNQIPLNRKKTKEIANLSISELFTHHLSLIKEQFPVIVTTNQVIRQLIKDKDFDFDLAFVFKNYFSDLESPTPTTPLATHTLTFSNWDNQEGLFSNNQTTLHNIHKKATERSFDGINHLIYKNKKQLFSFSKEVASEIQVKQAEGQFRQNANTKEADLVINDLINIAKNQDSKSNIAIVCTTIDQRDLIARRILQFSDSGHSDGSFLKSLSDRLSIFHLNEQRVNRFDHLLFSLCIQSFSQNTNDTINFLNSKNGFGKLINLLCSNFTKIKIYHSLPESDIKNYLSYKTKKSPRLIASWIAYSKTIQDQKHTDAKSVLDAFSNDVNRIKNKFTEEVANDLIPFIGKQRIQLDTKYKGIRFPLLISSASEKGTPIAILCDASLDPKNNKSHLWNLHLSQHLKTIGIFPITIWSTNWFESPALEARRLASTILKKDREQVK